MYEAGAQYLLETEHQYLPDSTSFGVRLEFIRKAWARGQLRQRQQVWSFWGAGEARKQHWGAPGLLEHMHCGLKSYLS